VLRRGAVLAGALALVCILDLAGQAEGAYAPTVPSAETVARSEAYLAANLAPLPEGWRWERRAVPEALGEDGFVRVGSAGRVGAPTVLFVPGFTGTAEQYADYYADWRARGWRVVSLDLPGQGGSSRGPGNPELPWPADFGRYAAAVRTVLDEEAAKGPLVVVGESFGGHVSLRALAEGAQADAAVLVVPALDANLDGRPRALTLAVAHGLTALGFGDAYVPETGPWQADWAPAAAGGFTGSCGDRADRIYVQAALYALRPELRVSGPSWGWLAGMQASGAALARPGALDAVTIPVRMVQSADDRIIENGRASEACENMADCELMVWDDTSHCLGVEEDEVRDRLHGLIAEAMADAVVRRGAVAGR
jgi:lysophospholipase